MVLSPGNLRQNYSMERLGGSGSNGNNSQQEGRSICLPLPHPAAATIDVKSVDWNRWRQVYIFPPRKFITRLLPKLQTYKFCGIFIAPWQPTAPWFPALFQRAEDHLHLYTHTARAIGTLRKSAKWLPKLRTMDRI